MTKSTKTTKRTPSDLISTGESRPTPAFRSPPKL